MMGMNASDGRTMMELEAAGAWNPYKGFNKFEPEEPDYCYGDEKRGRTTIHPYHPVPKVDRTTAAYKRITAAGFTIDHIMADLFYGDAYAWTCNFTCVCGRQEILVHRSLMDEYGMLVDVAAMLEDLGAVSVDHLRVDGYTEEQIARIRLPYAGIPDTHVSNPQRQPGQPRSAA